MNWCSPEADGLAFCRNTKHQTWWYAQRLQSWKFCWFRSSVLWFAAALTAEWLVTGRMWRYLTVCLSVVSMKTLNKDMSRPELQDHFRSFLAQQSAVGHGLLIYKLSRWRAISPSQKTSIWQSTTITTDRTPCLRRDSNTQSQRASGHRPTP